MFRKIVLSTVAITVALHATGAFAQNGGLNGLQSGGISLQQKAPRPNGLHVRFADQVPHGSASATAGTTRLGSTNYAKYGRVAPSESMRLGTTAHKTGGVKAPTAKQVHFDLKANKVHEIEKSGRSRPVTHGTKASTGLKTGMATRDAQKLNAEKKARSASYKAYKGNQHTLATGSSGGLKVKNGQVVPPKGAKFGTTKHVAKGAKTAKHAGKAAKATKTVATGAKVAKTGSKLKSVGKFAAGGATTAVASAALGVKVPDAVDTAMFAGKLVTDPKNAPKRLAGAAKDGVKMVGTAANAITDPGRMARNLYGAADGMGKSIARTKVYQDLAKTKTGREIGKATSWTKNQVGKGYNEFKKTKTAKTIGSTAKTVDKKVFKPANKAVNQGMKAAGKGAKKAGKSIAKAAKKLKFW